MAALEDVLAFIRDADSETLALLGASIKLRHQQISLETSFLFKAGDRVSFEHGKRNPVIHHATVTKVDRKWVHVLADDRRKWRVGPMLLKKL